MSTINITNARKELYNLVENVNLYSEPALIISKKGNAVLISEKDWNTIQETMYLYSIPNMVDTIIEGKNTPIEDCISEDEVDWWCMYKIVYYKKAVKDIEKLKCAKLDKKAKLLVDLIKQNPFQNPPPYEKLLGGLEGLYSRRINIQHRIVYEVIESPFIKDGIEYNGTVKIIRMWTHYYDVR